MEETCISSFLISRQTMATFYFQDISSIMMSQEEIFQTYFDVLIQTRRLTVMSIAKSKFQSGFLMQIHFGAPAKSLLFLL